MDVSTEDISDRSVTECHGQPILSVAEPFVKLYIKMYLHDCSTFLSRPLQFYADEFSALWWEAHEMKFDDFYLGICMQLWHLILRGKKKPGYFYTEKCMLFI